jgi:hypothetical protein
VIKFFLGEGGEKIFQIQRSRVGTMLSENFLAENNFINFFFWGPKQCFSNCWSQWIFLISFSSTGPIIPLGFSVSETPDGESYEVHAEEIITNRSYFVVQRVEDWQNAKRNVWRGRGRAGKGKEVEGRENEERGGKEVRARTVRSD